MGYWANLDLAISEYLEIRKTFPDGNSIKAKILSVEEKVGKDCYSIFRNYVVGDNWREVKCICVDSRLRKSCF